MFEEEIMDQLSSNLPVRPLPAWHVLRGLPLDFGMFILIVSFGISTFFVYKPLGHLDRIWGTHMLDAVIRLLKKYGN